MMNDLNSNPFISMWKKVYSPISNLSFGGEVLVSRVGERAVNSSFFLQVSDNLRIFSSLS